MKIVFNKIPKLAKYFYLIGFAVLSLAMGCYFSEQTIIDHLLLQQAFILGAIIVAIGSVINTIYQLKRKK